MGWDIIGDIVGDIFGTATQVTIEDWWRDQKKKRFALYLMVVLVLILFIAVLYSIS